MNMSTIPLPSATKPILEPTNSPTTTMDSPVDHGVIVAGVVLGSAGFIFLSICAAICVHFVGKKIRQRKHCTIKMRKSDHDRKQQERIRQQQQQEGKDYVLYQNLPCVTPTSIPPAICEADKRERPVTLPIPQVTSSDSVESNTESGQYYNNAKYANVGPRTYLPEDSASYEVVDPEPYLTPVCQKGHPKASDSRKNPSLDRLPLVPQVRIKSAEEPHYMNTNVNPSPSPSPSLYI